MTPEEFRHRKNRVFTLWRGNDCVILRLVVLVDLRLIADGRMADGRTYDDSIGSRGKNRQFENKIHVWNYVRR